MSRLESEPLGNQDYLTQKDLLRKYPDLLPKDCTWQRMLEKEEILAPSVLLKILTRAEQFLVETPGPNWELRHLLAPRWFGYWQELIWKKEKDYPKRAVYVKSDSSKPFEKVGKYLKHLKRTGSPYMEGGVLFVAGAEGHEGHIYAASHMSSYEFCIWVFEQDEYFVNKKRKAPYLPLPVRLSMWAHWGIDVVTVAPLRNPQVSEKDHYQALFNQTGAHYCFATEDDPNLQEKISRGKPNPIQIMRRQIEPVPIIPKLNVFSTSDRVSRLFDNNRPGYILSSDSVDVGEIHQLCLQK